MADGQPASLSRCQAPIWGLQPNFYYCLTFAGLLMWGALSDERTGLPFTIAAGPPQCNHSWVRVPLRFPQPGGPDPHIYMPQEQGDPVIPPGTGFTPGVRVRVRVTL
jgi:hypothetical protein